MSRSRHRYGSARGQFGELSLPKSPGPSPVVVLLHGGYWRGVYSYRLMRPIARALVERGFAVWNVEYRRVGFGGGGGGWPETFLDVAAAIDHLQHLGGIDPDRIVTCGHSAGGHLALWAAARPRLADGQPGACEQQQLRGAIALAGVSDLERLAQFGLGSAAVERLLGGSQEQYPERFHAASPAALLPLGVPQLLLHGLLDTTVPPTMSEAYVRRANALGDEASYLGLPGVNHRQIIESWHHAVEPIAEHLEKLLG